MITIRTLRIIGAYSAFINDIFGCIPYSWNSTKRALYVKTDVSITNLIAYAVSCVQALAYMI